MGFQYYYTFVLFVVSSVGFLIRLVVTDCVTWKFCVFICHPLIDIAVICLQWNNLSTVLQIIITVTVVPSGKQLVGYSTFFTHLESVDAAKTSLRLSAF